MKIFLPDELYFTVDSVDWGSFKQVVVEKINT